MHIYLLIFTVQTQMYLQWPPKEVQTEILYIYTATLSMQHVSPHKCNMYISGYSE